MKKFILASCLSILTLSACSGAAGGEAARGPHSQERSTAFKTLGGDMKEMGDVVKGNTAYDTEKFKAKVAEFVTHSQVPFKHFAQDGNGMDGEAKAEVWSAPEKFKAEENKFSAAVDKLNEAAKVGSLEQIQVAFGEVGSSCKSCHDGFKIKK